MEQVIKINLGMHYLNKKNPSYVILAAGKVGGIYANSKYSADFINFVYLW